MISVLYVEPGSGFGGSSQSLYQLLTKLDRNRFRPVVAAYHEGGAIQKIRKLGVPVHVLHGPIGRSSGYGRLLARWVAHELPRTIRLVRVIWRERVDLVHVNTDFYSTVAAVWAAALCRKPVVAHIRLTRPPTRLERWFGRWACVKITLTQEAQAFYQRYWPHDRIEWVPNGVEVPADPFLDRHTLRAALRVPEGHRVVGLIARCVPGKGYEQFLAAAKMVSERLPQVSFVIFGNGAGSDQAYEETMRRQAETLGLNGQVIWAGWQADARALYGSVDLVVQASTTFPEGASRILLEAMAFGRPVVATDIVGNREAVRHQQTGLLAPAGDADALAEAIAMLLQYPDVARRYGEQGRRHVAEHFSLRAHVQMIQQIYVDLRATSKRSG